MTASISFDLARSVLNWTDNLSEVSAANTVHTELPTYLLAELFLRLNMALFKFIVQLLECLEVFNGGSHLLYTLKL